MKLQVFDRILRVTFRYFRCVQLRTKDKGGVKLRMSVRPAVDAATIAVSAIKPRRMVGKLFFSLSCCFRVSFVWC